ncbi:MAG: hypothetical protein GY847_26360 [Proteobacteria bacterium]|nr:hypothetical protein [Pseudomonadota bacterium]
MGRIIKAEELRAGPTRLTADTDRAAAELAGVWAAAARIRKDAKNQVIDLALCIAKQVIGKAVELSPSVLDTIYSKALNAARDLDGATMYIHPDDRAGSNVDDMAQALGFSIVEETSVGRKGCRIQAGNAEIDATLDNSLAALEAAMKGNDLG